MRGLTGLVLLAVLLTGCSDDGGPPQTSPTPVSTTTSTVPPLPPADSQAWRTGVFVELPLDAYVLAGEQAQAVLAAHRLLIERCMRDQGYPYLASRILDTGKVYYPYGPTDPEEAAAYGYNQRPTQVLFETGPRDEEEIGLSPGYLQALLGVSAPSSGLTLPEKGMGPVTLAHGCTGRATLGLGPLPDPASLVGKLGWQAQNLVRGDPAVRSALDAWSICMDRAGRPFESPMAALEHDWDSEPKQEEIATALADIACKAAADLPRTWQQAEARAQRPLVAAHRQQLAQVRARSQAQVRRAQELLSTVPDPTPMPAPTGATPSASRQP